MKVCFLGTSHAPGIFAQAARKRGFKTVDDVGIADLIFVSQDTPTNERGERDQNALMPYIDLSATGKAPVVLTSQVEPGFTRSLRREIFYQADTLRMKDALQRAINPEMFIVGSQYLGEKIPRVYAEYLAAFDAPVLHMLWEDAEFAKVAINVHLAAQVDVANRLSKAANWCNADWDLVANALKHDRRIGHHSYLEPGDWRKSSHLLRDSVTVDKILSGK